MLNLSLAVNKLLLRLSTVKNNVPKLYVDYSHVTSASAEGASAAPLVDPIGRRHNYLRISLTERCNLRCQYCMPAGGVPLSARAALLSRDETLRLASVFAALGVDKVRLTGGEPTLRADLELVVRGLRETPGIRSVGMTTNGLVLTRRLPALQRAGLGAVNVSLDSLRADRYERMARRPGLSRVLAGVDLALQLGFRPLKINTVLMKGFNDDEILDFVEFTRDREVEVRFIEFMPFGGNEWAQERLVPHREALRRVLRAHPELRARTPRPHDTARVWQVPGYLGQVGFISSMTQNFCSTCNRLRLTADGNLKVCLLGDAEVSLRDALRSSPPPSDEQLHELVRAALARKKPRHAGNRARHRHAITASPASSATSHADAAYSAQSVLCSLRYGESRAHEEPSHDSNRGLARRPRLGVRAYSTEAGAGAEAGADALTHLDAAGRARMVDVGGKAATARVAVAECSLVAGARLLRLLRDARVPKGDALTVAEVAGVLAAKRTHHLIPLCHALPLDAVRVRVTLPRGECAAGGAIAVRCEARTTARTGAEMEALTGAAVAALALYDMCKAVDKGMRITELRVVHKAGGKSGPAPDPASQAPPLRDVDRSPLRPTETFAPTNFMHF